MELGDFVELDREEHSFMEEVFRGPVQKIAHVLIEFFKNKHTKLAILASLPTFYPHIFTVFVIL